MNGRMYLAGYRNGIRLSGVMQARIHNSHHFDETDAYFISLGIIDYAVGFEDYAVGFEDGWNVQPQKVCGPLEMDP